MSYYSITCDDFIDGLEDMDPILYLAIGAHDTSFPYLYSLEFVERAKGVLLIPPMVDYVVRGGHKVIHSEYDLGLPYTQQGLPSALYHAHCALKSFLITGTASFDSRLDDELYWQYLVDQIVLMGSQPPRRPFTLEAPFRAFKGDDAVLDPLGEEFDIVIVGEPGWKYYFKITDWDLGNPVVRFQTSDTIPLPTAQNMAPGVRIPVTPEWDWGSSPSSPVDWTECRYELIIQKQDGWPFKALTTMPHDSQYQLGMLELYRASYHEGGLGADKDGTAIVGVMSAYTDTAVNTWNWGLSEY